MMKQSSLITPLSIVLAFIGVIEATLAFRVTDLSGAPQLVFVLFMVAFPLLVLAGFFYVQIKNPLSWYPPSELDKTTVERLKFLDKPGERYVSLQMLSESDDKKVETFAHLATQNPDIDELVKTGKYKEALALLNYEAEQTGNEVPLSMKNDLANVYNNRGNILSSLGRPVDALRDYEHAIAIREALIDEMGSEAPSQHELGTTLNNLAGAYADLGDPTKALPYYERSISILKDTVGEKHPETIAAISNMASVYASLGEYSKALEFSKKALATSQEVLGEDHPNTLTAMNNVASMCHRLGKLDESLALYEKVVSSMDQVLGSEHPSAQLAKKNLEKVMNDQKR